MSTDPSKMSQSYREQEAKNSDAATNVYWAPAATYQIANFRPEKKGGDGAILQPEAPLVFRNHLCVADTSKEDGKKAADYIEASDAFKGGVIIKCRDREHAQHLSAQQAAMKGVKKIESSDISSTVIGAK